MADDQQELRRVNVNFAPGVYAALEQIAQERGKTMAETVRDAVTLERWVHDAQKDGGRILIERNGQTRELLLR